MILRFPPVVRFQVAAIAVLLSACIDKALPTQATSPGGGARFQITATFQLHAALPAQTVSVKVEYLRASGERVSIAQQDVPIGAGAQDVRVSVDLTTCLADEARVGARDTCPVLVTLVIRDGSAVGLDSMSVGPFAAAPGAVSVPFAIAASLVDTATVETGDTIRVLASSGAAGQSSIFSTSDPSVATVSSAGVVTGRTVGLVTITASSGLAATATRVQVSPRAGSALALTDGLSCALTATGAAHCWGNGLLGIGSATAPVRVAPSLTFTQISASAGLLCGLTARGTAYCMGGGNSRLAPANADSSSTPAAIPSPVAFQSIAVSSPSVCALSSAGTAYCWGSNRMGTLGTGDTVTRSTPTAVSGNLTFSSISAGLLSLCALTVAGAAFCWGDNAFSTLGIAGAATRSLVPIAVVGGLTFKSLRAGGLVTCGVDAAGKAYCWGQNFYGALGSGAAGGVTATSPLAVVGGLSFQSVGSATGNYIFDSSCGVAFDGTAYCWGPNPNGQIGTLAALPNTCTANLNSGFSSFGCTGMPTPVTTSFKFKTVVAGSGQNCGITTTHVLLCWGDNSRGQVGDGTITSRNTPVVVSGGLRMP